MISFRSYIFINFIEDDTPIGDFTRDVVNDPHFPMRATKYATILKYLLEKHACSEALEAFDAAYSLYEKGASE